MFELIDKVNNSKKKKFFLEKINIYIKLVELISKSLNLKLFKNNYKFNKKTFLRICELNIYKSNVKDNNKLLVQILKKNLYQQFIAAINFNVKYKRKIGNLLDKFDDTKRNIININNEKKNKFTLVDFFCGAGGFSYGFVQENFKIELANDNDWECIETYKLNHPEILDKKIIRDDIKKIINRLDKFLPSPIDVVIGGPPCQGFSNANQQRIINDPRNKLYKYFISAVKKINPKIVVMENVKGMYPYAEQVKKDFNNISYKLDYDILISDQFGVAQKRQRLFFIAFRKDIWEEKKINIKDIFNEIKLSAENVNRHILKDALDYIKPLKSPKTKNQTEIDDVLTGKKIDINSFEGNENSYLKLINQNRKIIFTFNHKARFANKINYQIFSKLKQGEDGTSEKIQNIFPYKHRNHIFKDKYFKLDQDKPSKTITAHLRMDCLSHIHPTQIRTITPREAARIQSFPDDYFFLGPYLKTYMQIGNAVPPIVSKYIAKVIKKYL
jgi:DNA (cytosine-5)-methyltransferase 1